MDFALQPANHLFSGALGLMLAIGLVELVAMMLGASLSDLIGMGLDHDLHIEVQHEVAGPEATEGAWAAALGWLYVGRAPFMVILVGFLLGFGLAGLAVQSVARSLTGDLLPGLIAAVPALAIALPVTRGVGRSFSRIFPKEETYAVSSDSFVGQVATVSGGTATDAQSAEGKLRDVHGRTHYLRVLADIPGETFPRGAQVLIVRRDGAAFRVISAGASPALVET
jgi:hypothetical protein